ncbi:MAG TPA: multidrug effflux MFS transporter [Burkholderiales bacterium]|nr:multidrug effflux MFS transporter [Burkholderiales bacterium]
MKKSTAHISLIVVLLTLVCLPRVSIDLYLPSLPTMLAELDTSPETLQLTLSLYMVGYAISMLICGPFSDRYGRKPVLVAGISVYIIATLVCVFSTSVWAVIAARVFQALGGASGTVIGRVMVRDQFDKTEQVRVLTYLSTGMALSPVIAPIVGGVIETYIGWRGNFVAFGIYASVALAMVFFLLRESHTKLNYDAINAGNILSSYKMLLGERYFMGYSLTISFAYCTYFAFISASPYLFQNTMGLSPIAYGVIFAISVTGYIVGSTLARKLSKKHDMDLLLNFSVLLNLIAAAALAACSMLAPKALLGIMVPMIVIMVTVGIIIPVCQVSVLQPYSKILATASGFFFFIQMIVAAVCGVIVGLLSHASPAPMAFVILASSVILGICFHTLIWRPKKQEFTLGDMKS